MIRYVAVGLLAIYWLLLANVSAFSQSNTATLSGRVIDATTGKPMPFANVYLNGSTRGTTTDEKGHFSLTGIPLGTTEIVASFIGYQADKKLLRFDKTDTQTTTFRLKPNSQILAAVTVRGNQKKWEKHFKQFKQQLLGEPFGGQCKIVNSDVLSFKEENGHLNATASEPILIENQALGYKLWYDMLYFDGSDKKVYYAGSTRFEELKPENQRQANRFRRNRMTAYRGSTRHLMASLVDSTYEEEGFLVYQENPALVPIDHNRTSRTTTLASALNKRLLPIRVKNLIRSGTLPTERRLVSELPLVVFYTNATSPYSPYIDARYAYSQIFLPNHQFLFTVDGTITVPMSMEVYGSLADDRLSRMLPADWSPNSNGNDPKTNASIAKNGKTLPSDARLERITTSFNERFKTLSPSLFLHIDKPVYATGDQLWLSAYFLDAASYRLPLGETAMHVDLLTATGKLVQHQWLQVVDGRAVGNFRLSDSLASGTYRLRAYTDEDDYQKRPAFERSIAVYNTLLGIPMQLVSPPSMPLDIQLLPEGGRWVAGLYARLGIKIVSPNGHGLSVSGRIVDDQQAEVGRFVTNRLGMTSLTLTPQPERTYYAEVVYNNQAQRITLPKPESDGFVFSVDAISDSTYLDVTIRNKNRLANDSVYVLMQQRGRLIGQHKILMQKGVAQIRLLTALFPPGLTQLTLYDATAQPQAERLVFIPDQSPPVQLIIGLNKKHYVPREQALLTIRLNEDGRPAVAALSASITDAEQVLIDTSEATIHTHLLLTGELRGRIEQPNSYFQFDTYETRKALDDLLLTQGWRRVTGTPDTDLLGGVSIRGRVLNPKNQPFAGAQVFVASTKVGQSFVKSAGADENGRFRLSGLTLSDTTELLMQLADRRMKDLPEQAARLVLEGTGNDWVHDTTDVTPNWSALRAQLNAAKIRQESDTDFYRDKRVKILKEVTVKARKVDERPDDIQQRSLHNNADATLIFDEKSPRFTNLYEMIRGRVAGVVVAQSGTSLTGGYQVTIRGMGSASPLYLVDGVPIQENNEGNALLNFNSNDIERIEVLKSGGSAGIYGARGGSGVIAFYTHRFRPDDPKNAEKKGTKLLQFIGYPSVQREFYVPHYDTPDQTDTTSHIDRRDVLYWKPLIQTDAQGYTQLRFPLSDVVRTLRITVQGITEEGHPVVGSALLRVQ